eukprot:s2428_g3.t17
MNPVDNCPPSQDMPVFANVLMGDRLESSRTFLETAVRSSLRRCEMPDSGDDVDAPNDAWIKFAVMGIIIISACVVLALGCYTYSVLRGRDDFRRRSLAARASQASLLIWTGLASATGMPSSHGATLREACHCTSQNRTLSLAEWSPVTCCSRVTSLSDAFKRCASRLHQFHQYGGASTSSWCRCCSCVRSEARTRSSVPGIDRALEINFKCEL